MKKLFTLLIFLLLWAGNSWGVTITIGTGTSTGRYPLDDYYVYSRSQCLYLASEITTGGNITNLRWYRNDVGADPNAIGTTEIWLMETPNTVLTGTTWEGPGTLVATISNIDLGPGGGWFDIPIASFTYSGTSNLLVSVRTQNAPYTVPHAYWRYTSTTDYKMRAGQSDSSNPPTMSLSYSRPNIQFELATGACSGTPAPGNTISSANPTCSGVNFTLSLQNSTPGEGVTYQWQSSPTGSDPWTSFGTSGSTQVTSQTTATYYRCQVTCSGNTGTSNPLQVTMNPFYACYCTSMASTTYDEEIFSVTVGGNTNAYDCFTVAPGPGSILLRYSNFYPLGSLCNMPAGTGVPFTVLEDECDGATYYSNGCAIWVDFNQDGDFADADEQVYSESGTTYGPRTITGNIAVPSGATLGLTGMRITVAEGYSGATLTPCLAYSYGETEDYYVTITQPQYGTLQGYVKDQQDGCVTALIGATVTNGTYTTVTDGNGFYQFLNTIPVGTYSFTASLTEYVSQTITGISVTTGNTTIQDFCLAPYLAPPMCLNAVATGQDVSVTWEPPDFGPPDTWIMWDDGVQFDAIGTGGAAIFDVASRWPVADIAPYDGRYLTKIEFYPYVASSLCTYTIKVWKGVNAATELYSYTIPAEDVVALAWNTAIIPGVLIDGTDEFWFGYECNTTTGYPAGCDNGPAIVDKGDMWYDGSIWQSIYTAYGLDYNWCLNGYVTVCAPPGPLALAPMEQGEQIRPVRNEGTLKLAGPVPGQQHPPSEALTYGMMQKTLPGRGATPLAPLWTVTGYNVYRNTVLMASNITDLFYDDPDLPAGSYDYEVSAQYDFGESAKAGPAHIEIILCPAPTQQTVANITPSGADLGWTDAAGTYWDLYIVPAGDPAPTPLSVPTIDDNTNNPYTWSGGNPNTSYDWYVRRDCGQNNTDVSTWTGPSAFTTPCESSNTFPWTENFDAMVTIGNNIFPDCWVATSPSGIPWWTGDANSQGYNDPCTSPNYAYVSWTPSSADKFLITPGFALTAATSYDFRFFWVGDGYNGWTGDVLVNEAQTGAGATALGSSFVVAGTTTTTSCILETRSFIPATTGTYYFMVRVNNNSVPYFLGFDDFYLDLTPSCPAPTGLTSSNITSTTADLDWIWNVDSFFDITYGAPGFDPETEGTLIQDIAAPPYTLQNLTPETPYEWYARSICHFSAPKIDHFWIGINETYGLEPTLSGGTPLDDPGEDGLWQQYTTPSGSFWYNIWFYNQPLDLTRMKIIRMGFWVQPLNAQIPGNISYVVNWSTPDWVPPDPPGFGYPMPPDEAHIERSQINVAPVPVLDAEHPTGYWMELYYIIPDYNPEWVSVDIWGTNLVILQEMIPPPPTSPLHYWWLQSPGPGGIIVHECVPKPRGYISPWSAVSSFTTLVACPQPTALNATLITAHSANLTWTPGLTETAWEYVYGLSPLPVPGGSGTATLSNTVNPISGLSESSTYDYYVRANCGNDGPSLWSGPYTFVTPASCPAPTALNVSNITTTSADVSWTPGGSESSWNAEVGAPGFTPGTGTQVVGINGTSIIPWTASPLTANTQYDAYVQAYCGFDQPKKENFWIEIDENYNIIPGSSGGAPVNDPGEDGAFYFYQTPENSWHNVWWYNGPVDLNRMKIIRMGFWVQRLNQQLPANITYVVNWSTPDWVTPPPPSPGFPLPPDEEFIVRSPINGPVDVLPNDEQHPNGYWVELYYVIPDFNPEWVSFDIWGQNVTIINELTPPPMTSPLYSWWLQDPQRGGILLHECLPKPLGNTSTWVGPTTFTTTCNALALPYCESFFDITWPTCWSQGYAPSVTSNRWSVSASIIAGGTANELHASWQNVIGESWLTGPPLTVPAGGATLSFKQFYDDFGPGLTLSVRYSNDGGLNWTTGYTIVSGGGNLGPQTITVPINLSGNVIIQWYMNGNHYQLDAWYIDDVCITPPCNIANTWTGNISNSWTEPGNWACGVVPGLTTNVIIPPPPFVSNSPVIAAPLTVEILTLDLEGDAKVTVLTGATLHVINP
jgi:hypothetical protein